MRLKKHLNILSLSQSDWAGCGYFLSQAINETTEHKSRAVIGRISRLHFPADIVTQDEDEIKALWKRADIIHIHDSAIIPRDVPPRPVVITFHGSTYRKRPQHWNKEVKRLGWLATAATFDLTLFGPRWLPDCRPDLSSYVHKVQGRFRVCQAPTKRHVKSTDQVTAAAKAFDFDLISKVAWEQCLKRKGRADVLVDQFLLGYGCNAIEAWLMGIPVIANASNSKVLQLIKQHAPAGFPFVRCVDKPGKIRAALERLRDDRKHYDEYMKRGRLYAERNHSYAAVAARAIEFYYEALNAFMDRSAGVKLVQHPNMRGGTAVVVQKPPKPKKPARQKIAQGGSLVLLRYVGHSDLNLSWEGEGTSPPEKYVFGKKKRPTGYVHEIDVQPFLDLRENGKKIFVRVKV